MYKIIERCFNGHNYTLGKTEFKLSIDDIFIFTYQSKDTKNKETNKYKVIAIDNNKLTYTVILWELGTFYNADWTMKN